MLYHMLNILKYLIMFTYSETFKFILFDYSAVFPLIFQVPPLRLLKSVIFEIVLLKFKNRKFRLLVRNKLFVIVKYVQPLKGKYITELVGKVSFARLPKVFPDIFRLEVWTPGL